MTTKRTLLKHETAIRDLCGLALETYQEVEALAHVLAGMLEGASHVGRATGAGPGMDMEHAATLLRMPRAANERGITATEGLSEAWLPEGMTA
jgi:hypothetical protein